MALTVNGEKVNTEPFKYYKPLKNIFVDSEGNLRDPEVPRARGSILLPEVTSTHPDLKDMAGRYNIASNDAITVANGRPVNMHLRKAVNEGAKKQAAWAHEHPYLHMAGLAAGSAPLAVAAAPAVVGGGELAATALANPYVDKGIISAFAGHGLNHAINEGIDGYGDAAMTALEVAPLGRLAKPIWNVGKEGLQYAAKVADNTTRYMSPSYDLYRTIGETKPKYTRVPSKNLFRTYVYKGGEITDPHSNFVTTDLQYAANYGKVTPYIFESKSIAKAKEPMMGYKDPVNMDMFIYNNTKRNPNATAIIGHDTVTGEFAPSKGVEILNMSPKNLYPVKTSKPSTIEWVDATRTPQITAENAASYAPKVNWDADNWFKIISGRNSYSAEEAAELASHVPEYRAIEQRLFDEGKLAVDSNGNIVVVGSEMSPQEYIMRQSEAFQKMNSEHHYVGVSKKLRSTFENEARDPATRNRYDVWTDRKSPKNVEEYAISQQGGYTNVSQMEKIENQMSIREENHELHKEQLKWKLEHGKISQETYDRDLAALEDNYSIKQKEDGEELKVLRQQEALDPLNGGKVFDVTYPRNVAEAPVVDAEGNHWHSIPYLTVQRDAPVLTSHYQPYDPVNTTVQTDQLVTASRRHGYGVTHIDNVKDTYDGTMLNETIIGRGTPVKSVLGNTGTFDIESPNKWRLYRSLLPPFLGLGAAGTLYRN